LILTDTVNQRGQRSILFKASGNPFQSIIVGKNLSERLFSNLISSAYTFSVTPLLSEGTAEFAGGILPVNILPVTGATHIRLFITVVLIPNYSYNSTTKNYKASDVSSAKVMGMSPYIDVTVGNAAPLMLSATIGTAASANQMLFCYMNVNYYQLISGVYNLMNNTGDVVLNAE